MAPTTGRRFDLNIDKILENWEIFHAVREIVANAIDEEIMSGTSEAQVFKDSDNGWHIRDFGRGLRPENLTQKENEQKLTHPGIIGKFGVGLKDALATFDRRGITVEIHTAHGDITLVRSPKHDFEEIVTLHGLVTGPRDQ